jgi:hypothetical protein
MDTTSESSDHESPGLTQEVMSTDDCTTLHSKYRYTGLDYSKRSICLIQILPGRSTEGYVQCNVKHLTVDAKYTCLSYIWGPPGWGAWIVLDGQRFWVRHNLSAFLEAAHSTRLFDVLIWIDALSIDQRNVQERNHQVQQMGEIYNNAVEVVAWLGDNEDIAMHLRFIHQRPGRYMLPDQEFEKGMSSLLSCKYWDRAWIVQELRLANAVTLMSCKESLQLQSIPEPDYKEMLTYMAKALKETADNMSTISFKLRLGFSREAAVEWAEKLIQILDKVQKTRRAAWIPPFLEYTRGERRYHGPTRTLPGIALCTSQRSHCLTAIACQRGVQHSSRYNMPAAALAMKTIKSCDHVCCFCTIRFVSDLLEIDVPSLTQRDANTQIAALSLSIERGGSWEEHWNGKFGQWEVFLPESGCIGVAEDGGLLSRHLVHYTYFGVALRDLCSLFSLGTLMIRTRPGDSDFSHYLSPWDNIDRAPPFQRQRSKGLQAETSVSSGICTLTFTFEFLLEIIRISSPYNGVWRPDLVTKNERREDRHNPPLLRII